MSTDDTKEFDVTRSPDGDGGADDDSKDSSRWTWVIPVALIGGLVLTYFFVPAFKSFFDGAYDVLSSGDDQRVQEWIDQFGPWGFVAIIGLMLLQTVVAFLPSLVMMVVSVLAYGSVTGGILAWVGLLLAASLGYAIGSSFGPVVVGGLISDDTEEKLRSFVDSYGIWAIVAARISPVLSTDAVSIVAGLARLNFAKFILATGLGTLPLAVLVAWLGADIERLQNGLLVVSGVSLVTFIGYVMWDKRSSSD